MKIVYEGADISTEEKFLEYINSLNEKIIKENACKGKKEIQPVLDTDYLLRRYKSIVAGNKRRLFMSEYDCLRCEYFQKLARKCRADCKCILEQTSCEPGGGEGCR